MDQHPRQRYETICEASPDAIVLVDHGGRITYANARVIDLFGYEPSELVGEPIEILVPESVRAEHVAKRDAYIADPETRPMGAGLDLSGRRKDGLEIPIDISLSPIESGGRREYMVVVRDVRDRETLRAKYQTILQAVRTRSSSRMRRRAISSRRTNGSRSCWATTRPNSWPATDRPPSVRGGRPLSGPLRGVHRQSPFRPPADSPRVSGRVGHSRRDQRRRADPGRDQRPRLRPVRRPIGLVAGVFRDVTDRKEYERQLRALPRGDAGVSRRGRSRGNRRPRRRRRADDPRIRVQRRPTRRGRSTEAGRRD